MFILQFLCIYRGIKIGALKIECITKGKTSRNIHEQLYSMFFNNQTMNTEINNVYQLFYFIQFLNEIVDDLWNVYLRDKYYDRCLEQANTVCKNRAVEVFKKYLPQLLNTEPLEQKVIMGIDPGFKNGCKCAIISENGRKIDTFKISINNGIYIKSEYNPPEGKKPMNDKGKYYKKYYPDESRRESSVSSSYISKSLATTTIFF